MSAFMLRHMLHPDSLHSNPASIKIWASPSASAIFLTFWEPGTTIAWTPGATFLPLMTSAAARRSSSLEFVHEPMKTFVTFISVICCPSSSPIYSNALWTAFLSATVSHSDKIGTLLVTGAVIDGFVPQLTIGAISFPSISIALSYSASWSVASCFHSTILSRKSSPSGTYFLPFR